LTLVPHGAVADVFVFVAPGKVPGSSAPMRRALPSRHTTMDQTRPFAP
jgi:hypothetical protein